MKNFTYEELRLYIEQQLAAEINVLKCRSLCKKGNAVHLFIKLDEDICYEPYWRGGPLTFKKGDYLHADPKDFYGLTAATFERCYIVEMPFSNAI
ncbi:MAG: hypothetical protein NC218_06285 [Acetobacter sp.]|nr:hypothetical protein [Acetobacter sp.]